MTDYNPNIPQGNDNLSTSQVQMLNNFGQLNTIFDADHFTWNDSNTTFRGMHRQVTFPAVLSVDPTISSPAGELYTKTIAAVTQLFFSNGSQVTQLTGVNSIGPNGSITLPGGAILKWGSGAFSGTSTALTIAFPTAFSTACYFASAIAITSTNQAANTVSVSGSSTVHVIVNRAGGAGVVSGMSVSYIAIGL